jgi:predicted nucleic acid-binding protein
VTPVAILDASVLYPSTIRSVLMFLAAFDAFRPQWSEDIHREWTAALARDRPDLDTKRIARTRALMEAHLPNAMVTGYQRQIASLVLPDPNDRHVLAAALHCKAQTIVTTNLKHFPKAVLSSHGISAQHPDDFVCDLIVTDRDRAALAFAADRARMVNPPHSVAEYIAGIETGGLKKSAAMLLAVVDRL